MPDAASQDLLPHDIAGPLSYLPYPLPVLIAMATGAALVIGLVVWAVATVLRRRRARAATARERARARLAEAERRADTDEPYNFSILVSDILRQFVTEEHHLAATTQTSHEFLRDIRGRQVFAADDLHQLERFLDKADMIKFARAAATAQDNRELLALAGGLVKGGAPHAAAA